MGRAEIYPFAPIGDRPGQRYPDWIRGLKEANGVYVIRERRSGAIVYIGESHSARLYSTLTRHFQYWSPSYDTAGPTYARDAIDVAVIVVPMSHAFRLQNDMICAIGGPRDNRVICDVEAAADDDDEADEADPGHAPRGYDYDVDAIIDALFTEFEPAGADEVIPF